MKAIVTRDPGRGVEAWKLVDRAAPSPGPGEVKVRMRAASRNYRDLLIARGLYGGPPRADLVPLADGAGEIAELGPGVRGLAVGQRVVTAYYPDWQAGPIREAHVEAQLGAGASDGVLAEEVVLPARGLVPIPDHLSFEAAATLPCAGVTAWNALFEGPGRPAPGDTVVVQGTGGVSIFAAQLALASGLRVIATTSSEAKARRLRELGVRDVLDYRSRPEWHEDVLRLTGGAGADLVLEVGGAASLARSLRAVRVGGTVGLIGFLGGADQTIDPLPILFRGARVEGVRVGSVASLRALVHAVSHLGVAPVIDEVFPLDRAPEALAKMAAGAHFGKIVVRLD